MNEKINVLDHGFVRLIDTMGDDLSISRNARVSYDAEWRAGQDSGSDKRLINYLYRNGHNTPFESVAFTFEVKAPIFVIRQWHRHRTWCLAGDTKLHFNKPCDGKLQTMTIGEICRKWNDDKKVARPDKQTRSLRDFNRERIGDMSLRCVESGDTLTETHITDCWASGEKETFTIRSICGNEITASADHQFLTSRGWLELRALKAGDAIVSVVRSAPKNNKANLSLTEDEVYSEEWRELHEVEVSNMGRFRRKGELVAPTINSSGRSVVSVKVDGRWKCLQLSRLVAELFLDGDISLHVLHKDDCAQNNRASNLKYGADMENHQDAKNNGRRVQNCVGVRIIESIENAGVQKTYDVTVSHDEHNFIAEGFCVHNCYNEISARYKELPEQFYVPDAAKIGRQSSDNKQMRDIDSKLGSSFSFESMQAINDMREHNESAFRVYRKLIEAKVPRELARSVLPVATYTHMFATVNLNNLFKFLTERQHEHAQYEIRVYADALLELVRPIVPVAVEAFEGVRS